MIDLKLNSKRLRLHWQYSWWKYVIAVAVGALAANLLFSMTQPQIPYGQRVDIYVYSSDTSDALSSAWEEDILRILPPDQKAVSIVFTPDVQDQDMSEVVAARMTAQEGTVVILQKSESEDLFTPLAASGAFLPLDDILPQLGLPAGIDLTAGTVSAQPDESKPAETHVYGIPLDKFPGLNDLFVPDNMVLAIPFYADQNQGNAVAAVKWLLSKTQAPQAAPDPNQFTVEIASDYFGSVDTQSWSTALQQKLNLSTGVGLSLMPYQTGREDLVAHDMAADRAGKPGVCIMSRAVFTALARNGSLMPLDDSLSKLAIPAGTDLAAGRETAKAKGKAPAAEHQYGIPLDDCLGFAGFFNPDGMMLAIPEQSDVYLPTDIDAANWLLAQTAPPVH